MFSSLWTELLNIIKIKSKLKSSWKLFSTLVLLAVSLKEVAEEKKKQGS